MKIELKEITVKELTEGYQDNNEAGVVGFGGKLDIRPLYHREFIYMDKQRDADAKRYFSKNGCPAYGLASDYLNGSPIRQDYLETTIEWISDESIEGNMAKHQHDENASKLWSYFQLVISWVRATFPKYRKEMKGIDWGNLYNQFKDKPFDTDKLESEITALMMDEDVTKKSGIYGYVLTGEEKHLNIRQFTDNQKREAYERQDGICVLLVQRAAATGQIFRSQMFTNRSA